MLTEEQQRIRQERVGASEAAAILGLCPFSSEIDVYKRKVLGVRNNIETFDMIRGQFLGPALIQMYAKVHDCTVVEHGDREKTHVSGDYPLLAATPDGVEICDDGCLRDLEAKAPRRLGEDWGDPGTDEVPVHYNIQCQVQMGVTGMTSKPAAVITMSYGELVEYYIPFEPELFVAINSRVNVWWEKHVVGKVPPQPDGTDGYSKYLNEHLYRPKRKKRVMAEPSQKMESLVDAYVRAKDEAKDMAEVARSAQQRLQLALGDNDGVVTNSAKVSMARVAGRATTNWKAIAESLGATKEAIAGHTKEGSPYLTMRVTKK